jgi:magnesium chelatase accessory protein
MPDLVWSRDGANWPHREASQFVTIGGVRWHVQRMGQGAPLLLIHGTGASSHSWRGLMPILARHYDVIAPDLPGHGFTQIPSGHDLSLPAMASDVAQLLEALKAAPEVVVGHSAGAAVLAQMCVAGQINPILLVSLNGAFLPYGGAAASFISPLAKLLFDNPIMPRVFAWQASMPGAVERLIANTGSRIEPAGISLYRKLVCSPSHVAAALRMMASWQLEPLLRALPELKPLLLLVTSDNDVAVPPSVAKRVKELHPSAIIERLHGLGHLAHEEKPQMIADLAARYARQAARPNDTFADV